MYRKTVVALLVAGIAAGAPCYAHAQEAARPDRVSAGGFWSANFATVSRSPDVEGVEGRQWVGGGLTVAIPFGPVWSLDARAFWNRRGARLPVVQGTTGHRDISADYVSMPLLIRASGAGTVRPYVLGGAELSVRLRARVRTVVGAADTTEDAASLIRRTDVAVNAGAGLERILAKSRVFIEALYSHGLRNVSRADAGDTTRTRTLTLLAGVRF